MLRYSLLFLALLAHMAAMADIGWDISTQMPGQLYPAYILAHGEFPAPKPYQHTHEGSTYTYLHEDGIGQFGVTLELTEATDVRIDIGATKISEASQYEAHLEAGNYVVYPKVLYNFDALRAQTQPTPLNVTFSLSVDGEKRAQKSLTVSLRAVGECPFYQAYEGGEGEDLKYMYAAYVNEDHPAVDQLLKEALRTGLVSQFIGHQGTQQDVINQIAAIWAAMAHRGIKYSSITTTSNAAKSVYSQRVRSLSDVLSSDQANCVDGSVFLASALRKIDIAPFLVLVPGHCYLGVYVDEKKTKPMLIETTLIGRAAGCAGMEVGSREANSLAMAVLKQAIADGNADYSKHQAKFGGEDGQYQLIDIEEARKAGINSIGL
jgi:hypothetical protein